MKLYKKRPVLTPQFDVNKLQKQLRSVIQTHLDQSANLVRYSQMRVTVRHSISR